MTTPEQNLISSKILQSMPSLYIDNVVKAGIDSPFFRPRLGSCYEKWNYPDGSKGGVHKRWVDKFNAMLPDSFFGWYHPVSEKYTNDAIQIMNMEVKRMMKQLDKEEEKVFVEKVEESVGGESKLNEFQSVVDNLKAERAASNL